MPIALTILTTTVLGLPLAVALAPRRRIAAVGVAFLLGTGVVFLAMLALTIARVQWSLVNVTAASLAISCAAVVFTRRRTSALQQRSNRASPHLIDLATALTVTAFAVYATIAPVWEWDFWAIWGLKARVFASANAIDWRFLTSRWNDFAHPDYPLLLPLNYAYAALANGGWSDRWLGLYSVAFGVAALLVIRDLISDELSPLAASTLTFAATAFVLSGFIGLAEAPLIAFMVTSLLVARAGNHTTAAILLGLAASSKNEGLSFLVAVLVAMAVFDRKRLVRMWPAIAIPAPWLILRAAHHLTTDITRGSVVERLIDRLRHTPQIVKMLALNLPDANIWMLIVIALAFTFRQWKRERVVLLALAIQLAFYAGAYFVTSRGVEWHIATSWPRLARQLAAPALVVVMLMLARTFAREDDLAHAEARSDL